MTKTPRPLPDLATLSAPKLRALIEKLDAANSANVSALIEAGLGSYRYSDTAALAKAEPDSPNGKLAALYILVSDQASAALAELAARRKYHGTDRPIKRPA